MCHVDATEVKVTIHQQEKTRYAQIHQRPWRGPLITLRNNSKLGFPPCEFWIRACCVIIERPKT